MSEQSDDVIEQETEVSNTKRTDNVGEISVEINVEELVAQLEQEQIAGSANGAAARKRLEDILEERRIARELEDLEDFSLDD